MIIASIGDWAFSVPDTWRLGEPQDKGSYLEAPDGSRGIYAYALAPVPTGETASESASAIQRTTVESYSQLAGGSWRVLYERELSLFGYAASVADVFDQDASYCIRFLVVCGPGEGLRLAIHDYLCESQNVTREFFDVIEQSVKLERVAA